MIFFSYFLGAVEMSNGFSEYCLFVCFFSFFLSFFFFWIILIRPTCHPLSEMFLVAQFKF